MNKFIIHFLKYCSGNNNLILLAILSLYSLSTIHYLYLRVSVCVRERVGSFLSAGFWRKVLLIFGRDRGERRDYPKASDCAAGITIPSRAAEPKYLYFFLVLWCSGNTLVFDTSTPGSIPGRTWARLAKVDIAYLF